MVVAPIAVPAVVLENVGGAAAASPTAAKAAEAAEDAAAGAAAEAKPAQEPGARKGAAALQLMGPWERAFTVAVFAGVMALLTSDQNLLAPNMSAAAKFFGLSEQQKDTYLGGYVAAGFAAAGAPSAIICGYLTGKFNRVRLLFLVVLMGHGPCLAMYFVSKLWHFILLRLMTGVAVGGTIPLVFSLLADLFPPSQRSGMAAFAAIAMGAGAIGGQMMAALVGPATNWRVPYLIVAVPSLLLASLMLLVIPDPPRGAYDEALHQAYTEDGFVYNETLTWAKVRHVLRTRSNLIVMAQSMPSWLPLAVVGAFLNDYLAQEKGLPVPIATSVLLLWNVGGGIGIIAGGVAGHAFHSRRRYWVVAICVLCTMATPGPLFFVINGNLQATGLGATMGLAILAGILAGMAQPNLRATVLNVNDPETRGAALALHSVMDDVGRGMGPIMVAAIIGGVGSRRMAFNISILGWVVQGLLLAGLGIWAQKEEAAVQARLAARITASLNAGTSRTSLLGAAEVASHEQLGEQLSLQGPWQSRLHRRCMSGSDKLEKPAVSPTFAQRPSSPGAKRFSSSAHTMIHVKVGRGSVSSGTSSGGGGSGSRDSSSGGLGGKDTLL